MVALIDIVPSQHAELLFQWRQRADIARFMYGQIPFNWAAHVKWLEALPADPSRRHWVIEHQGRPVGSASLAEIVRPLDRAMFGMYVADEGARLLGVGAAAEFLVLDHAFAVLRLQKVSCEVFDVNPAPRRMHERMGFKSEGILRRHAQCDGAWTDVHRLSLLVEEWDAARPALHLSLRKLLGEKTALSPL
jgi:UDP-4-amino-4,6-dideoxy-N-acetyl-beta-L-altrosamine N-acetyltransferase